MMVGFQVNTNTSILVSSLRETLSLSVLVLLLIKTADRSEKGDTDGKVCWNKS